ncbi:MAG: hypothetical protein GY953_18180, partial [bacterium]|nr:hypothetical protein [bacterium]
MASISVLKEQEVLETPLLLFECELRDGQVEYWSTHGVEYDGNTYDARVLGHNVFEMNAASNEGIDTVSKVAVNLANADSYFSQIDRNVGWKGAKLTIRFLFFDLKGAVAASESVVLFRGVANPPDEITESQCRLSFTNRLALQRVLLPSVRIQRRCPWMFPADASQRQESIHGGTNGKYSPFFSCGYSAGEAGGVGNQDGGSPYTSCDYTRAQCQERGMFSEDAATNPTRRFGGIEFLPASILVRSHGEQGSHLSIPVENEARYNDFVPLVYGTAWYKPPIVFARNDGNLTRTEVLLGMGEIRGVLKVLVNDVEIPVGIAGSDMTATGWYNVVSDGNRTGGFNLDFADGFGNPMGDPYGGMAYMSVVVPNGISDGQSLPRVQVLIEGLKLDRFDTNGAFLDNFFTNNPAWVVLDLLRRCGWRSEEIDFGSFGEAAIHCDESIEAFDLHGNAVQIPRYQCNLVVRKRRSAADLVRGVRQGSGLYLTYGDGGLLRLNVESSFATQHPTKPDGSNSSETKGGGWPVYEFGDGSSPFSGLLRRANGEPALRLWARPAADTPNRYTVEFQDAFNEYQQDSLSLVDVDDALLTGQEVHATLHALGLPNFSQAARIIRRRLDRGLRGNLMVEFETSVRAVHLRPGDLITLTYLKEGFQRESFRVIKTVAGTNHSTLRITVQLHADAWYTDAGGEGSGTGRQPGGAVGLPRPLVGSELDENDEPQFGVTEEVVERADGSMAVNLSVAFVPPAKPETTGVGIPLLSLAPAVSTTGGTLEGGQSLYYAVSAVDSGGAEGGLSFVVRAAIPSGTSTNQVSLKDLSFSADTAAFHVYRGQSPTQLLRIASDVAVTDEFPDSGLAPELAGPPDENYDHA